MTDKSNAEWKAVQNRQPLPPFSIHVTGKPLMPTPVHEPVLTKGQVQGSNPRVLILDLTATPPSGPASDVITPVYVEYKEEEHQEFDQVTIRSQVPTEPGETLDVEIIY